MRLEILGDLEQKETMEKMQFINHCLVPQGSGESVEILESPG